MGFQFLGEIKLFAGNFAPRGYALCNGQLLSVSQNTALFSLLGTMYGGNGQTTFALPDLRGRLPLHAAGGAGNGLPAYTQGQQTGSEAVTLDLTTLPNHTHPLNGSTNAATQASPNAATLAVPTRRVYTNSGPTQALAPASVQATGSGQSHPNVPPFLALNFIIATVGIFPTRP